MLENNGFYDDCAAHCMMCKTTRFACRKHIVPSSLTLNWFDLIRFDLVWVCMHCDLGACVHIETIVLTLKLKLYQSTVTAQSRCIGHTWFSIDFSCGFLWRFKSVENRRSINDGRKWWVIIINRPCQWGQRWRQTIFNPNPTFSYKAPCVSLSVDLNVDPLISINAITNWHIYSIKVDQASTLLLCFSADKIEWWWQLRLNCDFPASNTFVVNESNRAYLVCVAIKMQLMSNNIKNWAEP